MSRAPAFHYLSRTTMAAWWDLVVAQAAPRPELLRVAQAITHEWHGRHLGIFPPEALALAAALFFPAEVGRLAAPWTAVFAALDRVARPGLDVPVGDADQQAARGLLPAARQPALVLNRLAAPLWRRAQEQVGAVYLACDDETLPKPDAAALEQHRGALNAAVAALVAGAEAQTWLEETLWLLAREDSPREPLAVAGARLDPLGLRLLHDLVTALPEPPPLRLTNKAELRRAQRRVRDRAEEGYAGIHLTRRLEEVGNVLFSEFMQHRMVAADRLMNSGYLAYQRTPKRDPVRRTRLTALLPTAALAAEQAAFLKVCWLEAVMRCSFQALADDRLTTAMKFGFFDVHSGVVAHRCELQDLAVGDGRTLPWPAFRDLFLRRLGWPAFLFDSRFSDPTPAPLADEALLDGPRGGQTWRSFWEVETGTARQPVDSQRVLFLPAREQARVAFWQAVLALGLTAPHSRAFICWAPEQTNGAWTLQRLNGETVVIDGDHDGDCRLAAAALIRQWLVWWEGGLAA